MPSRVALIEGHPDAARAHFCHALADKYAVGALAGGHQVRRIVVTMGMPAVMYRWYFGAQSLRSLERSILGFCGIGPVRESLIGLVAAGGEPKHRKWLETMGRLGRQAR